MTRGRRKLTALIPSYSRFDNWPSRSTIPAASAHHALPSQSRRTRWSVSSPEWTTETSRPRWELHLGRSLTDSKGLAADHQQVDTPVTLSDESSWEVDVTETKELCCCGTPDEAASASLQPLESRKMSLGIWTWGRLWCTKRRSRAFLCWGNSGVLM